MPRYPIPPALKRWLIPVWNYAHQYGWLAYDYLNACGHGRTERCKVCGHVGLMLYRRRVILSRLVELWGLTPHGASRRQPWGFAVSAFACAVIRVRC
jgi:hypothetical protein